MNRFGLTIVTVAACLAAGSTLQLGARQRGNANVPPAVQGDVILKNFQFRSGESMPELKIHYRTMGAPQKDAQGIVRNAVLVMHGTGGSGASLANAASFSGELFGPGQLLDAAKYFIVFQDGIGHGQSSKPSDGMHAKFPKYGYLDMIEAEYRTLTELGVNHLRLVMGTSMGGMHTWLWGEEHPDMMDALMPLASVPTQISGRNRAWRRVIIDAIVNDPEWKGGEYTTQPPSLRVAGQMSFLVGDNPLRRSVASPTLAKADQTLDASVKSYAQSNDANNVLYAFRASEDYDPGPKLELIKAPLFAVNSADDLVNPPEIGVLEREIKRVPKGRAIVVPLSDQTAGHGTHTIAKVWKQYLEELLKISAR